MFACQLLNITKLPHCYFSTTGLHILAGATGQLHFKVLCKTHNKSNTQYFDRTYVLSESLLHYLRPMKTKPLVNDICISIYWMHLIPNISICNHYTHSCLIFKLTEIYLMWLSEDQVRDMATFRVRSGVLSNVYGCPGFLILVKVRTWID